MVIARFTVREISASSYTKHHEIKNDDGRVTGHRPERVEMRTIVMSPVYSNDPADPNKKFWDASPSGEIRLGTINPSAWSAFDLDGTYEVTFKKVE